MSEIVVFLIVVLIIASMFKISFLFFILYLFVAIFLLLRFWTRRSVAALTYRRDYEPRAFLGEDINVTVTVKNSGKLPLLWTHLREAIPSGLNIKTSIAEVTSFLPNESHTLAYTLHCRRRGYYPLGPLVINSGDLFGLENTQVRSRGLQYLTVYPEIKTIEQLGLPSKSPFGSLRTKQRLFEDPARVGGIRPYQAGDSIRNIHWKTTAATGELQVKKYDPAMTLETVIILDLDANDYQYQSMESSTERGIVVAASSANYLVGLRQEVGLLTNGIDPFPEASGTPDAGTTRQDWLRDTPETTIVVNASGVSQNNRFNGMMPRKGRGHLIRILELLARIEPRPTGPTAHITNLGGRVPFTTLLRTEAPHLPWGATLIIITARETNALLDTLFQLRRSGFNIVLILTERILRAPAPGEATHGSAKAMGFTSYEVWKEEDFDVWRRTDTAIRA